MNVAAEQTRVFRARYAYSDGGWRNVAAEYEGDIGNDTRWFCEGCDTLLTDEQEREIRRLHVIQ
mgnify:CR=1 FL=1